MAAVLVFGLLDLFIVSLGIAMIVLKSQNNCRMFSESIVKKHVNGFHVYGIKGGVNSCLRRMWKCQLPLRIYCGEQFVIGKDAVINFLDVLLNNIVNILVIIKV